ncbi:DUF5060 domain-containing protein [Bythopirellula polymerisocia]|uniref:DUF5060 domain-containing protein n=1 Tax=Bythopirellula polymerisocia TaxID=2528003 RepID=A0A5C6D1D2_9BACT|nr:DUF5060 domain-containing protein [Bythopirellula polymerisocia]TWU28709.1 hypothetical protein Pla144_20010 [Bythopirellula polymerisocia]
MKRIILLTSFATLAICTCSVFGKSSTEPMAAPDLVFEEIDGVLAVEAEHFISQERKEVRAWYRVEEYQLPDLKPDPDGPHLLGSSGASYLESLPDSRTTHDDKIVIGDNIFSDPGQAGILTYKVYFNNPGRYYVWVRHFSTGSEDNGIHVGLDGEWPESGMRWQTIKKNGWAWESRQRTEEMHVGERFKLYLDILEAGEHRIHFSVREDGFEFDKFVLASNRDYVPEGSGPEPVVKAGRAPAPKLISNNYKEAAPAPIESKVTDISKVGVKYKASDSTAAAIEMTKPMAEPNLVFEEVDGIATVEAEHFLSQEKHDIRAWFRVEEDKIFDIKPDLDTPHLIGSSGASYVEALPDSRWSHSQILVHGENFFPETNEAGVLSYKIYFNNPGRYYVWVRHYSTGSEDNGLHVGLNGQWPESGQCWQTTIKRQWAWESRQRTEEAHAGVPFALYLDVPSAGEHCIQFAMREDGLEFDKFVLASDRNYRPEGLGPDPVVSVGKAPPPKTLSSNYEEEDSLDAPLGPAVPLPEETVRLAATDFNIENSNFYVDQGSWLAINPDEHKTATASAKVPVGPGSYIIVFHAVGENDGESHLTLKIGDREVGSFDCPMSLDTFEVGSKFTAVFEDVVINQGESIEVTSQVASADGMEYSRGRWFGLTFLPTSASKEQVDSARRGFEDLAEKASKVNISVGGELKQWHKVTIDLEGPEADEMDTEINPFLDYRFDLQITHSSGSPTYLVPGYFASDGDAGNTSATSGKIWRAHFAPDKVGTWIYKTSFLKGPRVAVGDNAGFLVEPFHGVEGSFSVTASDKTGRDFRSQGRLQYVGKHHLQFAGSKKYFLKAGADSPETLLAYKDFDNTETRLPNQAPLKTWGPHLQDWKTGDPTWKSGKGKALIGALNYLAGKGVNSISFLTYNAGGDGDNVWPYVDRDQKYHFDTSKLDQWGVIFDHAQANGIYLHFKLQENEADDNRFGPRNSPKLITESLDGGNTGPERKLYLRELIARFGYHLALNWNLGEENTQSFEQQNDMAEFISEIDPYNHLIVIHTFPSQQDLVYNRLLGDNSLVRGASTQNKWNAAHQFSLRWIGRSLDAGVPWVVPNDEQNPAETGVPPDPGYRGFNGLSGDRFGNYDLHGIRKLTLWGNLMAGGAGVEYYFGYKLPENDIVCEDWRSRDQSWDYCRIALDFFENHGIPFENMTNANALIGNVDNSNTSFCLAKRDKIYVVYLPGGGSADLDLANAGGVFEVKWYDTRNGGALQDGEVKRIEGGTTSSLGKAPQDYDQDWAILVRKD